MIIKNKVIKFIETESRMVVTRVWKVEEREAIVQWI